MNAYRMDPKPSKARLIKNQEMREYNEKRLALIATAPELLETLKGVRDNIEALATVVKGERAKWHLVLDRMNATIAKAESR